MTKCLCLWLVGPSALPTGRIEDPECPARTIHDRVAGVRPVDDELLTLEFAYTSHEECCKDPYSPEVYCRRPAYHSQEHAAGFGEGRVRW